MSTEDQLLSMSWFAISNGHTSAQIGNAWKFSKIPWLQDQPWNSVSVWDNSVSSQAPKYFKNRLKSADQATIRTILYLGGQNVEQFLWSELKYLKSAMSKVHQDTNFCIVEPKVAGTGSSADKSQPGWSMFHGHNGGTVDSTGLLWWE